MRRFLGLGSAAVCALSVVAPANAATFIVDAQANSSSSGSAYNTGLVFNGGDLLTVSAAPDDFWSAGALPRWSNADGLTGNRFATGTDESGESVGTLIGIDFGPWNQDGFVAPYGALVGRIGSAYQLLGTGFSGPAWGTGVLELLYWDSNNGDNTGSIAVNVSTAAIPEPAVWAMMVLGFGAIGYGMRRVRRARISSVSYQ